MLGRFRGVEEKSEMRKSTLQWLVEMAPLMCPLVSRGRQTALRAVAAHDSSLQSHQHRGVCEKEKYFWHALRDCRGYSSLPSRGERVEAVEGTRDRFDGEGESLEESWKHVDRLSFGANAAERLREQEAGGGVAGVDWLKLTDRELQMQCRVETLRSSGPGGQHRNKTESAVRLLHLPTGLMAFAAEDRSQHKNRTKAFKRLREVIAVGDGQWNWRDTQRHLS